MPKPPSHCRVRLFLTAILTCLIVRGGAADGADGEFLRHEDFEGRSALVLSNDVLEVTVLPFGGAIASVVLKDDAERMNPMWDSIRADREAGRAPRSDRAVGHFVCVDGFGPASSDEREAGLPGHGEAHTLPWSLRSAKKEGRVVRLVQSVQLPRVHEVYTRTIEIADGENVVYVHGTLENLLDFDRPVRWTEHGTIGSPFLEPGVTVVDMSKNRAMTRPDRGGRPGVIHRLPAGEEFEWPMAPSVEGGKIDLRAAPLSPDSLDHTGHLMDPDQRLAYVTALHPKKRLLLGYIFKRAESPWLQIWESYPPTGMMARGLEFGTQAFDQPAREVVTQNRLFGTLLYRWLPARQKIDATFLMFWTRTPAGFLGVDDIEVYPRKLRIRDERSGEVIELKTSRSL